MKCEQVVSYLPGHAGGDLRAQTAAMVTEHLGGCAACRAEAARYERVGAALAGMRESEAEPPGYLLEAVLETLESRRRHAPVGVRGVRRLVQIPPIPPQEVLRVVAENRDAIASAATSALVAVGAAYALWRAVRPAKPRAATG